MKGCAKLAASWNYIARKPMQTELFTMPAGLGYGDERMTQDELIKRLVATGDVTRREAEALFMAVHKIGWELTPRRDGPLSVGVDSPSPRPSFSHERAKSVVAEAPKRRVIVKA